MKKIYIMSVISMISSVSSISPAISDIKKIGKEISESVTAAPVAVGKHLKQTGKEVFRTEAQKQKEVAEKKKRAEQKKQDQLIEEEWKAFEIRKGHFPALKRHVLRFHENITNVPIIKAMLANELAKIKSLVEAGGINLNATYEIRRGEGYATVTEEEIPLLFFTNNWDIARYLIDKGARSTGYKVHREEAHF